MCSPDIQNLLEASASLKRDLQWSKPLTGLATSHKQIGIVHNRLIFGEDMDSDEVGRFLRHCVCSVALGWQFVHQLFYCVINFAFTYLYSFTVNA